MGLSPLLYHNKIDGSLECHVRASTAVIFGKGPYLSRVCTSDTRLDPTDGSVMATPEDD